MNRTHSLSKRVFDLCLVLLSLPIWFGLLIVIAVLVRIKLGSPIFFSQQRVGHHRKLFNLSKFRTMTDHRGADGQLLPDGARLTPFGRWLRASSLDELPELFLVIRGDMSLIGPRPLPVVYLSRYNPRQSRRHEVLPGLSGWAQVNGRNMQSWDERFESDVWYVDNHSVWLDTKIVLLTFRAILTKRGVSADGHDTMPEFDPPSPTH